MLLLLMTAAHPPSVAYQSRTSVLDTLLHIRSGSVPFSYHQVLSSAITAFWFVLRFLAQSGKPVLWQRAAEHSPQERAAELAFYLQIPAVSGSAETENCR